MCRRVNLDTNVFIYHLQGRPRYSSLVKHIFRLAVEDSLEIVMSAIVQMELLVDPIRKGDLVGVERVMQFTEQHPNVWVADVSRPVIIQAAFARADGIKVADSLVLATGVVAECDATVTNDKRWRLSLARLARRPPMARGDVHLDLPRMVYLDEFLES
jgi:predicted nucleic acid-binding protein